MGDLNAYKLRVIPSLRCLFTTRFSLTRFNRI